MEGADETAKRVRGASSQGGVVEGLMVHLTWRACRPAQD